MDQQHDRLPLPARPPSGHKYTFGTVFVIAGAATMVGAPCFVGSGAFRSGAGMVRLIVPGGILATCLGILPAAIGAEAETFTLPTAALERRACIAIGPGMAGSAADAALLAAAMRSPAPVVVDGGALGLLPRVPLVRASGTVLTPHHGEYDRLAQALGLPALDDEPSPAQRSAAAARLAAATHATVVLKGRGTVVSDGAATWTCGSGSPSLAVAGSGDVLTGVIAGFIAQGLSPFDAARLGVRLHALAGEIWEGESGFGMSPLELAALIPRAMQRHLALVQGH